MKSRLSREDAEITALRALEWVAAEPERLAGFFAVSGAEPEVLGERLRDPQSRAEALGGLLDWLLADESALLAFCAETRTPPEDPMAARRLLPGFSGEGAGDWAGGWA